MAAKKVVVKNVYENLYKVSEYNGTYYVYHVKISLISNSENNIGTTRSFKDALDLIRSYSGEDIKSISEW